MSGKGIQMDSSAKLGKTDKLDTQTIASGTSNSQSIYEKFKQNTQKINSFLKDEGGPDGLDKGYQMLQGKQGTKKVKISRDDKRTPGKHQYRNLSQAPAKTIISIPEGNNIDFDAKAGSGRKASLENTSSPKKIKTNKLKISTKKILQNPVKLDKNLKLIENRILAKMKGKRGSPDRLERMPSIERNHSPIIPIKSDHTLGKLAIGKVPDYTTQSASKKPRYHDTIPDPGEGRYKLDRRSKHPKLEKFGSNRSQSIRQTVVGNFNPSDPSFKQKLQVQPKSPEAHSEYDLYNSYGSSVGFSDEKKLSTRMK